MLLHCVDALCHASLKNGMERHLLEGEIRHVT